MATATAHDLPHPWPLRVRLVAWSVPTVLGVPYVLITLRASGQSVAPWQVLAILVATWEVWAFLTAPIVRLADRFPVASQRPFCRLALHGGAALGAVMVQAAATSTTSHLLVDDGTPWIDLFVFWLALLAPAGVIVYSAIVALRTAQRQHAGRLVRERQARDLAAQLADAQLQALRAQVQPHFLFNTINAVVALVRDVDTARAEAALLALSALLRHSLQFGRAHEVPLEDDLAFARHYLALESLRFGDRLTVTVDVPGELGTLRVPALLLQPFVENAMRHGMAPSRATTQLTIRARSRAGQLKIDVCDGGAGVPDDLEARIARGVGISNVRARLRHLHGEDAQVTIRPGGNGGTHVEISLPARAEVTTVA